MRTIAILVGLTMGGCAASHAPCGGLPPAGHYVISVGGPGEEPDGTCPVGAALYVDIDDGVAPLYGCSIDGGQPNACGTVAVVRCQVNDAGHYIGSFEASLDLAWTLEGAVGGADVTWFDESGVEACRGQYDAVIRPLHHDTE